MKLFTSLIFTFLIFFTTGCSTMNIKESDYNAIEVSPEKISGQLSDFVVTAPNRNFENLNSLNKAADFINSALKKYGYSPQDQEYKANGKIYRNVIARYGDLTQPVLVVGAHYDVCGDQPGADDNASGIIGLLELARLIQLHRPTLPFCIEFVAFTLEEPPFFRSKKMGSYVHAESLKKSDAEVLGMVCLEMIGYFDDNEDSQHYPLAFLKWFYPTKGDFIGVVGNFGSSSMVNHFEEAISYAKIKVESIKAPAFVPGIDYSDHQNYWHFDYPAVMITDTSFCRNFNYHQVTDDVETLNYDLMAEVIKGVYLGIVNY